MVVEWLVAFVTLVAGFITITWFARDVRKENSKVLKSMAQTQEKALDIEKGQSEILAKIEEGQRKLAEICERGFETMAQILAKIEAK